MEISQHTEHLVSALNDLVRINKDRITGYKKRIDIALDDDLELLFAKFIYQSLKNILELTEHIYLLGGSPESGNHLSGKFYHAWIDFKSTPIRQDRKTLLDYCEYGEDVVKSAYRKLLDDKELLQNDKKIISLLTIQFSFLIRSHGQVKDLFNELAYTRPLAS